MKWLLTFLLSVFIFPTDANVSSDNFFCSSYVVYDGLTNNVLEGDNVNIQRSVASISKIMTAIVTLEYGFIDDFITVGDWINKVDGSSVYLYVGEVICVRELLYGLMLRSGNDCAVTLAMFVSGNISSFVDRMNIKAREIGMVNTLFRNPSGLDSVDGGNLSTSYDMALLSSYAMKNDVFRSIVACKEYKSTNHGTWINKNKLLTKYEYVIGGKTGYTKNAKRTLVSVARKGETELIVVTLNCGSDFNVHANLYNKWFDLYKTHKAISQGYNYIDKYEIFCDSDIYVVGTGNKTIINYHLNVFKGRLEVSVGDTNKIAGMCQITKKINKNKKKNIADKLKERLFNV